MSDVSEHGISNFLLDLTISSKFIDYPFHFGVF